MNLNKHIVPTTNWMNDHIHLCTQYNIPYLGIRHLLSPSKTCLSFSKTCGTCLFFYPSVMSESKSCSFLLLPFIHLVGGLKKCCWFSK